MVTGDWGAEFISLIKRDYTAIASPIEGKINSVANAITGWPIYADLLQYSSITKDDGDNGGRHGATGIAGTGKRR